MDNRKLWLHAGISLQVTAGEARTILDQEDREAALPKLKQILREGRYQFEWDSGIPAAAFTQACREYGAIPEPNGNAESEFGLPVMGGSHARQDETPVRQMSGGTAIQRAQACLQDNGIAPDETGTVLQALFYILFDREIGDMLTWPPQKGEELSREVPAEGAVKWWRENNE